MMKISKEEIITSSTTSSTTAEVSSSIPTTKTVDKNDRPRSLNIISNKDTSMIPRVPSSNNERVKDGTKINQKQIPQNTAEFFSIIRPIVTYHIKPELSDKMGGKMLSKMILDKIKKEEKNRLEINMGENMP